MAGDWIKMRMDLQDDPAVLFMAATLKCDRWAIIGRLHKVWCWADRHADSDGRAAWVNGDFIDAECCLPGFAQAMQSAGWLEVASDGVVFPDFDTHNGESAKKRSADARRKRESRGGGTSVRKSADKCPQKNGQVSAKCPPKNGQMSAKSVTREEKRREEKISLSSEIEPGQRERDLILSIMRAFELTQPSPTYRAELERLAGILDGRLADGQDAEAEIRARIAVAEKRWKDGHPTPNAIIDKHWDALTPKKAPPPRDFAAEHAAERKRLDEQKANAITPEEARELLRQNNPFKKAGGDEPGDAGEAGESDVSELAESGRADDDAAGDAA